MANIQITEKNMSAILPNLIDMEIVLDSETTSIDPFLAEVIHIQLGVVGKPDVYWAANPQIKAVLEHVIYTAARIILHNGIYDAKVLYWGYFEPNEEILQKFCSKVFDTRIGLKLLNENGKADLDSWVQEHYQDSYKPDFWSRNKSYQAAPLEEQVEYACQDIIYTTHLYQYLVGYSETVPALLEHVQEFNQKLLLTSVKGLLLDKAYLLELGVELQSNISKGQQDLFASARHYTNLIEMEMWCEDADKVKTAKAKGNRKRPEFNWSSGKQVMGLLYGKLKLPKQINKKTKNSTIDDEALEKLAPLHPIAGLLQSYRTNTKMYTSFVEGVLEKTRKVGNAFRVHPEFDPVGTVTLRSNCIEENQLVDVLGGKKAIKDVKVGDLVYCVDTKDDSRLSLRPVKRVICNGLQECVKVSWQSAAYNQVSGQGNLICTPEHRVLTRLGKWKSASSLSQHERVVHLHRGSLQKGRHRLYSYNPSQSVEETLVKKEHYKVGNEYHLHHKNHNKWDNRIDNFELLSPSEHLSYHSKDRLTEVKYKDFLIETLRKNRHKIKHRQLKENQNWIIKSKWSLLRMLIVAGGSPSNVPMDFNTYKRKCALEGINLKLLRGRFNYKGAYLSRGLVNKALEVGKVEEAARILGIGTRALKSLCITYNITYNHCITSVTAVGLRRVYDLEIEEYHNFFASEVCVHNCKLPNFQQLPADKVWGRLRGMYIPEPGFKLVTSDYQSLEVYLAAALSEDPTLLEVCRKGTSFHDATVEGLKEYGVSRAQCKTLNFAILYGGTEHRVSAIVKTTLEIGKKILDAFWATYPGIKTAVDRCHKMVDRGEHIVTCYGNKRRAEGEGNQDRAKRQAFNFLIQSTGAGITNRSFVEVDNKLRELGIGYCNFVMHDELIVSAKIGHEEEVATITKELMELEAKKLKLVVDLIAVPSKGLERWEK